jgi:hypothetical protein
MLCRTFGPQYINPNTIELGSFMTKLTKEEARAGTDNRMPRHVLFIGTALAIVGLTLAFWYFAA